MVPAPPPRPQPLVQRPVPPPPPVAVEPLKEPGAAGAAKVALLVPLSGANAELGRGLLDAAQMALFDNASDRLALAPRDTGGTADGAANAAKAAIADGARLILGPLLAVEVEAVKPLARDAHINLIALSTVVQLAGGNAYLMGFLPQQEVGREVGYARQRGLARFAALAPSTPYGRLMADALREAAGASGAAVAKVEFYDPRAGDAAAPIRRLIGGGEASAAAAPGPAFDALMLPEGGARLKALARQLAVAGLDTRAVRLLGSGLWDEPDIGDEPALVGGWFAAPAPEGRRAFEQRFEAAYGHRPPRLASLGYDAAALASVLARAGGDEPFSAQAIQNPSGFTGVDGLFRFGPDGLVQRGLAVLEVTPQGSQTISPAPQSFQDLGY
jgi:branched-chain amino acid transport system substrate-binding protein